MQGPIDGIHVLQEMLLFSLVTIYFTTPLYSSFIFTRHSMSHAVLKNYVIVLLST
jgi:hypothetical protein